MKDDDPIIEAGPGQFTLFYKDLGDAWRKAVGKELKANNPLMVMAHPSTVDRCFVDRGHPEGDKSVFSIGGVRVLSNPHIQEGEVWLLDETPFASKFPNSVFDQIRQEEVRQSVAVMTGISIQSDDASRYLLTGCEGDQPVGVSMRHRVWLAVRMLWFKFIDLFRRRNG